MVWLVFDAGGDLYHYQCYWFGGRAEDHLREHAQVTTEAEAVVWGLERSPRVRIRLSDHRTYWAGAAPDPGGFAGTWAPRPSLGALKGDEPASVPAVMLDGARSHHYAELSALA